MSRKSDHEILFWHFLYLFICIHMPHLGRDWNRKRLYPVLRYKLEIEKSFRDTWMKWTVRAIQRSHEKLAHNLSATQSAMLQKKATCYMYNQFGTSHLNYRSLQWNDFAHGYRGTPGTGDWVNLINMSSMAWYQMLRGGYVLAHRCHVRGLGSDIHLNKGGYEHRWKKCMDRDMGHYTRP